MPIAARFMTALIVLVLSAHTHAHSRAAGDVIIGKVVSVADGDTITVLVSQTQHRIRLYGIDAPERRQDFSNRAKQFVSDLVFGKQVRVVKQDIDRYGRVVGTVYVGDVCVNEELVRNGLAWVYRHYCKISVCVGWLDLEARAREEKVELWSHPDPVAPWEYRRSSRTPVPRRSTSNDRPGGPGSYLSYLSKALRTMTLSSWMENGF